MKSIYLKTLLLVLAGCFPLRLNAQSITVTGDYHVGETPVHVPYNGTDNPWNIGDRLTLPIAASGNSSLEIQGAAVVNSQYVILGSYANQSGVVVVDGVGATLNDTDSLNGVMIGRLGAGQLGIQNGGLVTAEHFFVGFQSGGRGTVRVLSGANLILRRTDGAVLSDGTTLAPSLFRICDGGQSGTLEVFGGGSVSSQAARIGIQTGSVGTASVGGANSKWITEDLTMGEEGIASLHVTDGGMVEVSRYFRTSYSGSSTINVLSGGHLSTGFTRLTTGFDGHTRVKVSGQGSSWEVSGDLFVGGIQSGSISLDYGPAIFEIQDGGTVSVSGTMKTWDPLTLVGGTLQANVLDVSELDSFSNGGTSIDVETFIGTIDLGSGILSATEIQGSLNHLGGTLAPGNSPGLTSISEDYTLSDGSIDIEISGLDRGDLYDSIDISGLAVLNGGELHISFLDSFEDSVDASDSFTILTATGGVSGTFNGISDGDLIETSDGLGTFKINYEGNSVVLTDFATAALLGDVNTDGTVDFLDISPFITVLSGNTYQAEADCDENELVDFLDIAPFIAILTGS